jgi:phosphate transport system substrate-binding protein
MMVRRRPDAGRLSVLVRRLGALAAVAGLLMLVMVPPASATPAALNGSGSTYVALAMQQWLADAQTQGLHINYAPLGSPAGLTQYGQGLVDFAGTEAEFASLQVGDTNPARGFQYVPDVAGAVAIMYHVQDSAGNPVTYLHLSRETIAKIFMGGICNWNDPAITADNRGLVLPNQPISVVYRGGQSGTTGLFYDFVQHTDPAFFASWAARNEIPTNARIIELDTSPSFACHTLAENGSDQIAEHIASAGGMWSIGYDEFGYAKTYNVPTAWVQNASGAYQLPYAQNISAALESAQLNPDLSQNLAGVYASSNPLTYPISAYSYLVTQCAPSPDRSTCKGAYGNPGITETLSRWMRYIACDGQVNMAAIGYSPLPPNLSQEIANAIARMAGGGATPETLTAANCANPRFRGELGADSGAPPDPIKNVVSLARGSGAAASSAGASGSTGSAAAATGAAASTGAAGATHSAGGGSGDARAAEPVLYQRPIEAVHVLAPILLLLAVVIVPPLLFGRFRRRTS